jgi:hypothetical protein
MQLIRLYGHLEIGVPKSASNKQMVIYAIADTIRKKFLSEVACIEELPVFISNHDGKGVLSINTNETHEVFQTGEVDFTCVRNENVNYKVLRALANSTHEYTISYKGEDILIKLVINNLEMCNARRDRKILKKLAVAEQG